MTLKEWKKENPEDFKKVEKVKTLGGGEFKPEAGIVEDMCILLLEKDPDGTIEITVC